MNRTVTVVVCAYTEARWDDLVALMRGLREQTVVADHVVLVVDHDEALLARAVSTLPALCPGISIVANASQRGLSGARNTGVAAARGDVVAFVDDDAFPTPRWLETLVAPYADDTVVGTGGRVTPRWPSAVRPGWFPSEFDWVVGCSYKGLPTEASAIRNPIGASMSFRRDRLTDGPQFTTSLGRVGTLPVGCEETELSIRLTAGGGQIRYVPDSEVLHRVSADRTRVRYFLRRCYAEGTSKAHVSRLVGSSEALAAERRHVLRTLPRAVVRGFADVAHGDPAGAARAALVCAGLGVTALGYARGALTRRRWAEWP